jgi:hypothetical protein
MFIYTFTFKKFSFFEFFLKILVLSFKTDAETCCLIYVPPSSEEEEEEEEEEDFEEEKYPDDKSPSSGLNPAAPRETVTKWVVCSGGN